MDDIRKIGFAYFSDLAQEDKKLADEFFNRMFGFLEEIRFEEYLEFVRREKLPPKIANKDFFKMLDVDGNSSLNLEEAKPLYYISKNKILECSQCPVWLFGSFFLCQCSSFFALCPVCYEDRKFGHHNGHNLSKKKNALFNGKTSGQKQKSELQLTAEAYYHNVAPNIKDEADKFFREMDKRGNKKIGIDEFISYMKEVGYEKMANFHFFMELNRSGSGQLDFMEVMTLYYVIQSRRPFCEGCNTFIDGLFFTCNDCFNDEDDKTFNVCISCFKTKKYKHQHNSFVDNYSLLESKRIDGLMEKKRRKRNQRTNKESYAQAQPATSTSTSIVPYDRPRQNSQFMRWLSATSSIAGIIASGATILSSCSIM